MPSPVTRGFLVLVLLAFLAPPIASAQVPDPVPVQLTFSGNVMDGAVSPDGRFLAYVESSPTEDDRLLVRPREGGDPVELVRASHVFHLRWSPTSEALLVGVASDTTIGEIRLLPRTGGPGRTFDSARWFAWSPDETAFAFAYYSPHSILLRDLDSGRVDTLALPGSYHTLLDIDWSRQGDRLAYVVHRQPSRYEVRVIDRSGSRAHSVVVDSVPLYSPRWSRDGEAIYYSRSSSEIIRVELNPDEGGDRSPRVVARLERAISFDLVEEDAAISFIGGHGPLNLALFDFRSGRRRPLTMAPALDHSPIVSPDGREVAFIRSLDGVPSLQVLELASGKTRAVVAPAGGICCPAWSPDGREIAYFSSTGAPRLWRVSSSGGAPALVSDGVGQQPASLQWAPQGRFLVQAFHDSAILWIDAETGSELPIGVDPPPPTLMPVRLSPDGSKLVGWTGRRLVVVSLPDGATREIDTDEPQMPIGWSPDGDGMYAYESGSSRILRHSLSNARAEVVGELDCPAGADMLPDGSAVVCVTPPLFDLWTAVNGD